MTKPVYLFAGEEFLAQEALERLRAEVSADPLSEVSFDPNTEATELIGALETASLLGGVRIVIVRDAGGLKKELSDAIETYLQSPSPQSVLVLIGTPKGKLTSVVKASGAVIKLDAPKGRRLVGWIRERAGQRSLKVDERGAWTLIDAVGPELRDLDGALEQLVTGLGEGARVSTAEVRRAFPRLADERIYAFTDAVGERKLAAAIGTLRRLLEQGDEPLMLFGALSAHVRRMLSARRLADQGPRAVGDALGMPEWRAERLHRQIRSFREEELIAAMEILAETDFEMKGGDLPPEIALEKAVLQIVSGPVPV